MWVSKIHLLPATRLDIYIMGVVHVTKAVLPKMLENNNKNI